MTSKEFDPKSTSFSESHASLVTSEFQTIADRIIDEMVVFSESGGQTETPESIIQTNAYSTVQEAERDEFMYRIGERLNRDIDAEMTVSERNWRQTDLGKEGKIWLEPWMKSVLKLDDPDEGSYSQGIQRLTEITTKDGQVYWLEELEVPTGVKDENNSSRELFDRIIWMFQTPV